MHLNHADVMIAEKMAQVVTSNLRRKEDPQLIEDWAINLVFPFQQFLTCNCLIGNVLRIRTG